MKEHEQEGKDGFWTERAPLFTAQFPTYYTNPQKVWGRFHTSEEQYNASSHEIIPIKEKKGQRTYVMMQPYVREPNLTLTVGIYNQPKKYHRVDIIPVRSIYGSKSCDVQFGNGRTRP
jgi:hypothetical protein